MVNKNKKILLWEEIKAAYLLGATPLELSKKFLQFNLTPKQITEKASKGKWAQEKAIMGNKIAKNLNENIERLTTLALDNLERLLDDKNVKDSDKIAAIGRVIDISGLKSVKQEVTNKNKGFTVVVASQEDKELIERI